MANIRSCRPAWHRQEDAASDRPLRRRRRTRRRWQGGCSVPGDRRLIVASGLGDEMGALLGLRALRSCQAAEQGDRESVVAAAVAPGAGHLTIDQHCPRSRECPPYLLASLAVGDEQGPVDLTQVGIVGRDEDDPIGLRRLLHLGYEGLGQVVAPVVDLPADQVVAQFLPQLGSGLGVAPVLLVGPFTRK